MSSQIDPQVMEQNIRNVMSHWTSITQEDLTKFFNALRANGWDEGYTASDEEAYFFSTHGCTPNPYRKQKDN